MGMLGGVWNIDQKPVDCESLAFITRSTRTYGDGDGIHLESHVAVLYRPFHTTTESRIDHQPLNLRGGQILTFDGRLDNREELLIELGYTPTSSDAQVVAAAFECWGDDCFRRFIGDWALSIWNPCERSLRLARDYIGVRQLFYYIRQDRIQWCSNLAPLVLCGDTFSLSEDYIARYLALHFEGHLTPYAEIKSVSPGTCVVIQPDRTRVRQFWSFDPRRRIRYRRGEEYEEHFRHLFRRAVERRLRAESAVLADLSGGLDSSSIVCVADAILREKGTSPTTLNTFSYSYLDEPDGNDMEYVMAVEAMRQQSGHHVELRGEGESFSLLPWFSPTPSFRPRSEVIEAKMKVLSQHGYRVHISGLGGDEFLGQALEARLLIANFLFHGRLSSAWRELMSWSLLWRQPLVHLLLQAFLVLFPASIRCWIGETQVPKWISNDFAQRSTFAFHSLSLADTPTYWFPAARDAFQTHSRIAGILTNLSPSAAEERYPFLDQDLTEFLMSIPIEQQLKPGERRSLMRRALAGTVPNKVLLRRTKQKESRGLLVTLNKHWAELQELVTPPITAQIGVTNEAELRASLEQMLNGHLSRESAVLLRGIFLEVWIRALQLKGIISIKQVPEDLVVKAPELAREASSTKI